LPDDINAATITVDLKQNVEEKTIQDIALSMEFLRLEESVEYPIGVIDELYVTERYIYILDKERAKSLFIYDRDGKFVKAINTLGQGPGEFVRPGYFDIQQRSGNIIILDRDMRKLLYYTPQGDFISEIKLNAFANSFAVAENNTIVLDKGNTVFDRINPHGDGTPNYIHIITESGEKITELLPVPELVQEITITPRNPLQKYADTLLFMPSLSNKIYGIHENNIALKYQVDFGGLWPGESYFEKVKGQHPLQIAQGLVKDNYVAFLNYLESREALYFDFKYDSNQYSYYYNKGNGKSIMFYNNNKEITVPLAVTGNTFVSVAYRDNSNPALIFYDVAWEKQLPIKN
jgi:hypothetical protein